MKYNKTVTIKDGRECILRNGDEADGQIVYDLFVETHAETDFLLSYPEENTYTAEEERNFLKEMTDSENGIEIIAVVDGKAVGCAGIEPVGKKYKVKHRAEFGISVLRDYWYLGIGSALTAACIAQGETDFEVLYSPISATAIGTTSLIIGYHLSGKRKRLMRQNGLVGAIPVVTKEYKIGDCTLAPSVNLMSYNNNPAPGVGEGLTISF